ncbi:putative F-box/kelch-repeat protein [Cocos nucifera]|uniref:Putative F-box/kelch-repeat protein n=1 Tax=Cocos nucifera TaxID=13894 RepID=A0A8K0N1V8_COCNU|nr:putative F-box/kelch-repeat protein [Cocos nucifera]
MQEIGDQEEEQGGQSSCQWAELHPSLLQLIHRRLALPDYLRFGAVCQPWFEANRDLRHPYAEVPMLFFSKVLAGRSDDSQLFFSPSDGRCYHIDTKLEGSSERHVNCIASTHGWLLVHDFLVPPNVSKLFLLNPFSGARIELPDCQGFRHYFGRPIALSSSPTDPSCQIMVAHYLHVMHCRLGDAKPRWTKHRIFSQPEDFIHDITFLHENQRFYGLTNKYDLVFLDYIMDMDTPVGRVDLDHSQLEPLRDQITQPYLVACMGEILLV